MAAARKPSKRPWRSHYTKDWRSDPFVRGLKLEARMVYLELLDIAWDEDGLQAEWVTTGSFVAQQIGISRRKFVSIWGKIRAKFVEFSPGIWSNPRLENERKTAEELSEKQRNNVKHRYTAPTNVLPTGNELVLPSQSQSQSQSQEEKDQRAPSAPRAQAHVGEQDGMRDADNAAASLPLPGKPTAASKRVVDRWRAVAEQILAALSAARKRVRPASRDVSPSYDTLAHIADRLEGGASAADCLHVVEVCEAECAANPDAFRWFDAITPFRRDNFVRKCAADPALASAASAVSLTKRGTSSPSQFTKSQDALARFRSGG